jgi:hypothetical protein
MVGFDMANFLQDVFAPESGERITFMIDLPHGTFQDNREWRCRRKMASRWHRTVENLGSKWNMKVNPLYFYPATGHDNADLPEADHNLRYIIESSTIIISMPEFSATAPLYEFSRRITGLRIASMPGVAPFMEETGLAADYSLIEKRCRYLVPIFKRAVGAEVLFSSGHSCYFDLSVNEPYGEDGILHPDRGGTEYSCCNLPAGEVYVVPNEKADSLTSGELPFVMGNRLGVLRVVSNRIVEVVGKGRRIDTFRNKILSDPGWQNIAEFAIGINDRATVTGNVLQDEKAGFHWAFGRSDHLGGITGTEHFNSPKNVVHHDIVYARGNPVSCSSLDMIFPDHTKTQLITDGSLVE